MPDEPTPKQPSDSSTPRDWESASEKDVEQKLALAGELAGELAGHVGAAPTDTSRKDAVRDAGSLKSIEKDLDAELNDLEHLVGKTQAEVGEDKSSALAGTKPPALEMTAVGSTAASPGTKGVGAAGPPPVRSVKPGVIGTGTLPVTSDDRKDPSAAAEWPSLDPGVITGLADASVKPVGSSEGSGQWNTLLLTLCERGVRILERIDQPFARLGGPVRHRVGFVAVATAVVSIVVIIYSLM